MAGEQRARHDLVINSCGRKRITAIIESIVRVVQFGHHNPFGWEMYTICSDGVLHWYNTFEVFTDRWLQDTHEMSLSMQLNFSMPFRFSHAVDVRFGIWPGTSLSLDIPLDLSGVIITVTPVSHEDLQWVAFLLSEGLAQFIHNSRKLCEVRVRPMQLGIVPGPSVVAGVRAQIAPLLPFASRYIPAEKMAGGYYTEERLQIGPVVCPPQTEETAWWGII